MPKLTKEEIDELGKTVVPEGMALERDRAVTAKTVFNPQKADDWRKYFREPNRTDMRFFDTKKEKEPTTRYMKRELFRGDEMDYWVEEPDRFVREGTVTRQQIDKVADEIVDYESFKTAIKKAFMGDKNLRHFWAKGEFVGEKDWEALWNTEHIQNLVQKNQGVPLINYIMERFEVEPIKAKQLLDSMSPYQKAKTLTELKASGRLLHSKPTPRRKQPAPVSSSAKPSQKITQTSAKGREYTRSKPIRWGRHELQILNSYSGYSNEQVRQVLQRIGRKRTLSSIRTKRYRLGR